MSKSPGTEQSFLEHLGELRTCLLHTLLGAGVCSVLAFFFSSSLFSILSSPLIAAMPEAELVGLGPAEAFIVKLKVALVAGIVISSPFSFYQLWKFVSPGLHPSEQKFALPFVAIGSLSFLTGLLFCFWVILPFAFRFFLGEFQSINVEPTIRIGEYLGFVIKLLLVFGLVFELPVFSWFLARFGLITPEWLVKNGRYAILVIFVIAAILTPPDIATQLLLAGPLIVLYGICIQVVKVAEKKGRETPTS